MIFKFIPWCSAIKPLFGRICFAFSKHLKQIPVDHHSRIKSSRTDPLLENLKPPIEHPHDRADLSGKVDVAQVLFPNGCNETTNWISFELDFFWRFLFHPWRRLGVRDFCGSHPDNKTDRLWIPAAWQRPRDAGLQDEESLNVLKGCQKSSWMLKQAYLHCLPKAFLLVKLHFEKCDLMSASLFQSWIAI